MKTIIQSFAAGILVATIILSIVYFIENNKDDEKINITEENAKSFLEEQGFYVILSSDYNQLVNENKSLKDELINLEEKYTQSNENSVESEEVEIKEEQDIEENDEEENVEEDDKTNIEVEEFTLTITRGMTSIDISKILLENYFVKDEVEFNQFLENNGFSRKIQLGQFIINPNMSYLEIANVITRR